MVVAVNGDGTVNIAHNENVSVNHAHVEEDINPDGNSRWGTGGDKKHEVQALHWGLSKSQSTQLDLPL